MHLDEHKPRMTQRFWCNKCDAKIVDTEKPETGKFYVQFGHGYSARDKDYTGDYTGVMFALCPECDK